MPLKSVEIRDISSLLMTLETEIGNGEPVWFRGHAKHNWSLLPGYQRIKKAPPEHVLINRFKQNASLIIETNISSNFDWLFTMQHYGAPTRLLDWSESVLFALYFAVNESPNSDGALWLLKPLKLNKIAFPSEKKTKYIPSFDDPVVLNSYSTESLETGNLTDIPPAAALATRNNTRIQAQLGAFTISLSKIPIEDVGDGSHVTKLLISKKQKAVFRRELSMLGVTKFQLFPELVTVGELVKGIKS